MGCYIGLGPEIKSIVVVTPFLWVDREGAQHFQDQIFWYVQQSLRACGEAQLKRLETLLYTACNSYSSLSPNNDHLVHKGGIDAQDGIEVKSRC